MRNLLVRTATGVVFVALVLGSMLLGRVSYTMLLACIAVGCIAEFWRLAKHPAQKWLGGLYILLCMAAMWFFPLMSKGMGGYGSLTAGAWDARMAPAFVLVVWANDVFAYLTGITLGRGGKHPLCKTISPKKSWEGFVGGLAGAIIVAVVIGVFWIGAGTASIDMVGAERANNSELTLLWAGFGLAVALASVAGDLAESRFKRRAGVKDSGAILPGHGGLLDRFDAMLGAAPVAFLFLLITFFTR